MTGGVRARLFAASIAVIVVVGLVSTLVLRHEVADTVEAGLEAEVVRQARAAAIAIEGLPTIEGEPAAALIRRLAEATGARVEVFAADGAALARSADAGVAHDVHERPEVRAVLGGAEVGLDHRGGRLVVAVPWRGPDGRGGVVRLSAPMRDLGAAYHRLHLLIAAAAVLGIVVAVAMTLLASRLMNRAVRDLAAGTRDMALGRARRVVVDDDDLGDVGVWINHLAEDVDRAATALDHERQVLGSILDGVSHGVVGLDDDRRITVMNEAARTQLELGSTPIGEAFIDHVRLPGLVELIAAPGSAGPVEISAPGGARLTARVVALSAGRGRLLLLEDVTAMRRLETIRSDFVANVSHELRTPVAIIRANAETLLSGAKDEPRIAGKLIEGMHRNAERLTNLLNDLLDLSRLEAGHHAVDLAPIVVREAIDQAVASLGARAEARGVTIVVDAPDELCARADAHALDQVLVNLTDNAIKYTDKQGKVWVEARRDGDRVRIQVRDDGPGIAPRHRERVFERFYRVDPGRSRELGGTGLGLSIVKHLVENMGGTVGVAPNEPRGTIFWVALPVAEDSDPDGLEVAVTGSPTVATL